MINVTALEELLSQRRLTPEQAAIGSAVVIRFTGTSAKRCGKYASVTVTYYRKLGIAGRRYARGPSAQKLCKIAKRACFTTHTFTSPDGLICVDVDINNCYPTLLRKLLLEVMSAADFEEEFPMLDAYVSNYRAWRDLLAQYGVSKAKRELVRLFFLGKPSVDLPMLWALAAEVCKAVEIILSMDAFAYLRTMFSDRRSPRASRLSYALASQEDMIVSKVQHSLRSNLPTATVSTLMFDGMVVCIPANKYDTLCDLLKSIGDEHHVSFSTDTFSVDGALGAQTGDAQGGAGPSGRLQKKPARAQHSHSDDSPVEYTNETRCALSGCGGSLKVGGEACTACVWNGGCWERIKHGRKQCRTCGATHRVSYVWDKGAKICLMTEDVFKDTTADPYVLVENYCGFKLSYLRQFSIRQFRCAVSCLGEASTMIQTWPGRIDMNENNLSRHLGQAVLLYLCFQEGRYTGLNVEKPVADDDAVYGGDNKGFFNVFDAWQHDPGFDCSKRRRDVVADGNKVLTRPLTEAEKAIRKRGSGRPAMKQNVVKRILKRPTGRSQGKKTSTSRCACAAVAQQIKRESQAKPWARRSEGVYATVDMRSGEVLQLGEMLNAECRAYKEEAATLVQSHVTVGTMCLDTACSSGFEGTFCQRCLLDAWHAKKHKCSRAQFDPAHRRNLRRMSGCNSEAAEQLWSRTDKLGGFATHFGRGNYRLFLRSYCAWRNAFKRGNFITDVSGCVSIKTRKRHGDWI